MKVYVINMDRDHERMMAVSEQLKKFDVPYVRFGAVDARVIERAKLLMSVDRFRWWCAVGRPVRVGEIGCAMSHCEIYRKMLHDGHEAVCVLEDDVIIGSRFKEVLKYVENHIDSEKPQVVLLSNHVGSGRVDGECRIEVCKKDMYTEGYVVTHEAARTLLNVNIPMQCPCDWWGRWAKLGIIELYHAFPTVCSQDQNQFESGTVDPNAFNVKNLSLARFCLHKLLRLIGKTFDRLLPI